MANRAFYIATSSGIHKREPVRVCRVPTANGVCGHPFYEDDSGRDVVAHNARCVKENEEHIRAYMARKHPEIQKPWDTDLDRWIAKHKDALVEGRLSI